MGEQLRVSYPAVVCASPGTIETGVQAFETPEAAAGQTLVRMWGSNSTFGGRPSLPIFMENTFSCVP